MSSENLYILLESAYREQGFNINGVWDRINYTAKTLLCDRMIESGSWKNLPEEVLCLEQIA